MDTGIAGINFEDNNHREHQLFTIKEQAEKIELIKKTALGTGTSLFINARTDVYILSNELSPEEKLAETLKRGKACKEAGADCFYPIFLKDKESIAVVIKEIALPVNILLLPGIPDFETLHEIGLSRLSLGPGFLKTAINSMKSVAEKLLHFDGMTDITNNPITSAYLKNLVTR